MWKYVITFIGALLGATLGLYFHVHLNVSPFAASIVGFAGGGIVGWLLAVAPAFAATIGNFILRIVSAPIRWQFWLTAYFGVAIGAFMANIVLAGLVVVGFFNIKYREFVSTADWTSIATNALQHVFLVYLVAIGIFVSLTTLMYLFMGDDELSAMNAQQEMDEADILLKMGTPLAWPFALYFAVRGVTRALSQLFYFIFIGMWVRLFRTIVAIHNSVAGSIFIYAGIGGFCGTWIGAGPFGALRIPINGSVVLGSEIAPVIGAILAVLLMLLVRVTFRGKGALETA